MHQQQHKCACGGASIGIEGIGIGLVATCSPHRFAFKCNNCYVFRINLNSLTGALNIKKELQHKIELHIKNHSLLS